LYKGFRGWERDVGIHASLNELIGLAKTAGFRGVEIDMQEAARLADEKGIGCVGANVLPTGWPLNMIDLWDNEAKYRKGLAGLPRFAKVGRQLGSFRVVGVVRPYSDDLPFKENFEWHVERLKPVARILKNNGCVLGLEYIGSGKARVGHKHEFIHTLSDMVDLCDAVGTGNVGILLDSFHWYTAQETLSDIQQLTAEQVVYVHVNDAPTDVPLEELGEGPRCIPGETGVIDLVGFLKSLKQIGYDGPIVPEPNHRFCDDIRQMSALEAAKALSAALDKLWLEAGLS